MGGRRGPDEWGEGKDGVGNGKKGRTEQGGQDAHEAQHKNIGSQFLLHSPAVLKYTFQIISHLRLADTR